MLVPNRASTYRSTATMTLRFLSEATTVTSVSDAIPIHRPSGTLTANGVDRRHLLAGRPAPAVARCGTG